MRATQTTTYRSLQSFLDRTTEKLQTLQTQAATGKRLNRPSDDPTAISPVLSARTQIQNADRYTETIQSGLDRINNMDGYLDDIENTLVRIKEISIAAVNGSLSSADRQTYADEVGQLRDSLLDDSNAQIDGKYIFAGYSERTKPFTVNSAYPGPGQAPVLYNGDNGVQQLEISPNELIDINLSGNVLMKGDTDNDGTYPDSGAVDIFSVVTNIQEALQANDPDAVEAQMNDLDTAANQVRKYRSIKGNLGSRLETANDHMGQIKIDMESFRSRYEDADILDTITSLQQQEQSYQAALDVTGRISKLSILDYL